MIRCDLCGRFCKSGTWAEIYDMSGWSGLEYEAFRCDACTEKAGPATTNARPYDGDLTGYQGRFGASNIVLTGLTEPLEPETTVTVDAEGGAQHEQG
jgi:hypothetical protein